MYQVRNLIGRSNVSKSPGKNFNASDDFIKLIITSYIVTAAMEYLKMDSLTDSPSEEVIHSPSEIWTLPLEERKALLMKICGDIVESFISFEYHSADDGSSSNDKVNAQKQFIFNYSLVTIYVTRFAKTGLIAGVRNCSYSPFSSAKSI